MKNKNILIIMIFILLLCVGCGNSKLSSYADNTKIGKSTTGYKLDLRIYGKYNGKNVKKTVMIDNYKNTDKKVNIAGLVGLKLEDKVYILKDKKYYEVVDNKLKEVKSIIYEDTDIYLKGVYNIKNVSSPKTEKLGEVEYTVYTGKLDKKVFNDMLKATDLDITVSEDGTAEVWITKDNRVYKAYYKTGELTIYPSFLMYNKISPISLDTYK